VINYDKVDLPVCAFGAGLAHAAALALILPIMITLPAPADPAPPTVAIHVEIRTAAAAGPIAEGDAEEIAKRLDTLGSEEVTAALPAPAETGELTERPEPSTSENDALHSEEITAEVTAALPVPPEAEEPSKMSEPDTSRDAFALEPEPDEDQPLNAVASVDADETPAVVPIRLRKPALNQAVEERKAAKPEPRKHVTAHRPQARVTTKRPSKKFLGGRTATPMPEYPF
jgi:hypothetical protein